MTGIGNGRWKRSGFRDEREILIGMAGFKNTIGYTLNGFGWVERFIENLSLGSVSGQGYLFYYRWRVSLHDISIYSEKLLKVNRNFNWEFLNLAVNLNQIWRE